MIPIKDFLMWVGVATIAILLMRLFWAILSWIRDVNSSISATDCFKDKMISRVTKLEDWKNSGNERTKY